MQSSWICLFLTAAVSALTVFPSTDRESHVRLHTLPQFRPPLLNVTVYDQEKVSPGYIFVGPYSQLAAKQITDLAEAYTTGPTIFDSTGVRVGPNMSRNNLTMLQQLIWVGSTIFPGRDAYDFKTVTIRGETMLSYIISPNEFYPDHPQGKAVLVNDRFELVNTTLPLFDTPEINIHEYRVIDDGLSVLMLYSEPVLVNKTWIQDDGIAEVNLTSGATLFRWSALEHIPLNASNFHLPKVGSTTQKRGFDWFHANSIDKNADGDYLLSSRHASSIYKISGSDGSVMWELSGKSHDIDHSNGFNFSWQHDARFRYEDKTKTIISFFDNAGVGINEEGKTTGNWSRAVVVELNTSVKPMTTRVLHSYDRPDHQISIARGNTQTLPNDNVFIGWATHGLISELTLDGTPVMEAKFQDGTMSTYRSYKFNFTGKPHLPPVVKSIVHGTSPKTANTFHYFSWNGATEVRSWNIYGASKNDSGSFSLLASVEKTDFETMFMTTGFMAFVYVEAVGVDGIMMRKSIPTASEVPRTWIGTFCTPDGVCNIKEHDGSNGKSGAAEDSSAQSQDDKYASLTPIGDDSVGNIHPGHVPGPHPLHRVMEDRALISGIGLMIVLVLVYFLTRFYRRRNTVRYQHVE
ncbi:hypothetical protein E4T38_01936 [Aureobasidium subglaciale]|nr:hypothetical protein E4T38_01936 [Aureobasidium subglaciale]KAI5229394.1 hypothetical protein E4T40_01544 [Aureobasidium subglaciale]KAI5233028.1 hypothetical protein E4T41_01934 [Aureobasidium subglaciale]KAI5266319.1 hypothetical protein E4T46_01541 [Aureobasidium subglaciale]